MLSITKDLNQCLNNSAEQTGRIVSSLRFRLSVQLDPFWALRVMKLPLMLGDCQVLLFVHVELLCQFHMYKGTSKGTATVCSMFEQVDNLHKRMWSPVRMQNHNRHLHAKCCAQQSLFYSRLGVCIAALQQATLINVLVKQRYKREERLLWNICMAASSMA